MFRYKYIKHKKSISIDNSWQDFISNKKPFKLQNKGRQRQK